MVPTDSPQVCWGECTQQSSFCTRAEESDLLGEGENHSVLLLGFNLELQCIQPLGGSARHIAKPSMTHHDLLHLFPNQACIAVGGCSDVEDAAAWNIRRSTICFVLMVMQVPPVGLTACGLSNQKQILASAQSLTHEAAWWFGHNGWSCVHLHRHSRRTQATIASKFL